MPLNSEETVELLRWLGTEKGLEQTALDLLQTVSRTEGAPIDGVVLTLGLVDEVSLVRFLAELRGHSFQESLTSSELDAAAIEQCGLSFFLTRGLAPLIGFNETLVLATAKPLDETTLAETGFVLNKSFVVMAVPSAAIRHALREYSAEQEPTSSGMVDPRSAQTLRKKVQDATQGGATARQIEDIVADALALGSSDIHVEATATGARVRFRINGVLRPHPLPAGFDSSAAVARLKTLGGMSVTERRLPQDGRATIIFEGRIVELRLSTMPTQHGESIVARVLDPKALRRGWSSLSFDETVIVKLKAIMEQPSGLFIVAGPTGSGKTTTLYTMLAHLNDGRRKIVSVEDPVEYGLDGVEQVQVNAAIGLTFGAVLRATLRQDPDVLMVGEIRDSETAEISCRAALIGRLVLATVHASSSQAVRTRLIDLGVPSFLVDDVLLGVLSQRLVISTGESCEISVDQSSQTIADNTRKPIIDLFMYRETLS